MTLVLKSITGAKYDQLDRVEFELIASMNGASDGTVFHEINGRHPAVDAACRTWLETNTPSAKDVIPLEHIKTRQCGALKGSKNLLKR